MKEGTRETTLNDLELPLRDSAWLVRLARSLTADASLAEDAAQETWLAALARGGNQGPIHRGWLRTVLVNALRKDHRQRVARQHHEQVVAQRRAEEDSAETERRLEIQAQLVRAVAKLGEPNRGAIVARYFDGCSPREIAQRQGVPVRTVHSRLNRGLEQLRRHLDAEHAGERRAWSLALAACIYPPPALMGTSLMASKLTVTASALALTLGLLWWGPSLEPFSSESPELLEPETVEVASVPPNEVEEAPKGSPGEEAERSELASVAVAPASTTLQPGATRVVSGWVNDLEGKPVAGAPVRAGSSRAISSEDGRFELELAKGQDSKLSLDGSPLWVNVYSAHVLAGSPPDGHRIVVSQRIEIDGHVRTPTGEPIPEADLSVTFRHEPLRKYPFPTDRSLRHSFGTRSEPSGSYQLSCASLPGVSIVVNASGFEERALPLPTDTTFGFDIVLEPLGQPEALAPLTGRVVDAAGNGATQARVRLGRFTTRCDDQGQFELRIGQGLDPRADLVASLPGTRPCVRRGFAEQVVDGAELEPLRLELGPATLNLGGRLINGEGEPLAGWEFRLLDREFLFVDNDEESLALDDLALESPNAWTTGSDGGFELAGLPEDDVVLRFWDPANYVSCDSPPLPTGTDGHVVRMLGDGLQDQVAGTIVDSEGQPVPGAEVILCFSSKVDPHGMVFHQAHFAKTGQDGAFLFREVPERQVFLHVRGENIVGTMHLPEEGEALPREELEIAVERRFHFRFTGLSGGQQATHLRVLDAADQPLGLTTQGANGSLTQEAIDLFEGRSHVVLVSERARTVVLLEEGVEIDRIPVRLQPGVVNEISK